ncbi:MULTISPECIES: TMEM165/GDT1 family protein [unclassified Sphingomonas]|jgi:Ca2+/H+ antiporter, TMEM165/GDT1 family|uniref:TMEM165/GDT1 family protein n=1 Tax=unclassified Sphingomonas TaxID=196159 RepID=UPI000A78AADC|nr:MULTISPECIES: TMEM165/GDT1 family protein [unclassified Sphingomonas]
MEALVPAFLLAVLTQLCDKPAMLGAILADRYGRPLAVAFAAGLAHAATNFAAAVGGALIGPMMTPNARALLLAMALIFGALGAIGSNKVKDRLDGWKLGSFFTAFLGVLILSFGESTPFFTLALSTGGQPWFAATGASIGAFAVAFVAAALGERSWAAAPWRWVRILSGISFLIAGCWIGVNALRLT